MDFNGQDISGLGRLNYEARRGMYLHPTYVVTPAREPLGVLDAWMWARDELDAPGERARIKESARWTEGYERVAEAVHGNGRYPPGVRGRPRSGSVGNDAARPGAWHAGRLAGARQQAKRSERPMFGHLSREAMLAVIGTPDGTWFSQRDHVLLLLLYNTGARVSEIVRVKVGEVVLDDGAACVHLHGKGRKQRSVPLWRSTVRAIRAWLKRNPQHDADSPLLPNRDGQSMSRWNVMRRLDRAVQRATQFCPELATCQISPHTIRHTTAMHLLQAGVDVSVIALWLGHESPATTHQYVEADLAMKERALARLHEPEAKLRRYRAPDSLIDFLRTL